MPIEHILPLQTLFCITVSPSQNPPVILQVHENGSTSTILSTDLSSVIKMDPNGEDIGGAYHSTSIPEE